jgi:hypothetical protein
MPPPRSRPMASPKPQNGKQAPPPPPQTANNANPQPPPQPLDLTSPDKKPDIDLPPGWMCVWSKSQKRWYFFNTRSNKSVWQWPPP